MGVIFFDENNKLNIYEGIHGEANCCPAGYNLTVYQYNPEINTFKEIETKNYSPDQFYDLDIIKKEKNL